MIKRIMILLTAVLLAAAAGAAAAEEPETEPAEAAAEISAEEFPEESAEEPAGEYREDPESAEEPAEEPAEETWEEPAEEEPAEEAWEEPQPEEEPAEEPAEETWEEPAEEEPAEETWEEPAEEPAAEESAEESAEEAWEEPVPAACAHEHIQTVYYFDAPDYRPLNDESHLVIGQAVAETSCLDCGEVLSVISENDAEEIRPHVFRNNICALCGREGAAEVQAPSASESVVHLSPSDEPDQYFCALTDEDLEQAGDTLVLRPEGRDAALAVQTGKLREEIRRAGGSFTAELRKPGEGDVSTSLCLYDASGEEMVPEAQGISLRIYTENNGRPLTVSFTNLHGATSTEEARWVKNNGDEGYWIVTWLGDGVYQYQEQ